MPKFTTNRVDITIVVQKKPVSIDQLALFQKSARDGMAAENLNDLFKRVVSKSHNNNDKLDLNIDDTDKLKDM